MTTEFDPYYVWLGIPSDEQPPNLYRLLGVRVFEHNAEVIQSAADRQMAHVNTFKVGKNAAASQDLLTKLSAAAGCLLNPSRKAEYDAQLRSQYVPETAISDIPLDSGAPTPLAIATSPANMEASSYHAVTNIEPHGITVKTSSSKHRTPVTKAPSDTIKLAIGGVLAVTVAIMAIVYFAGVNVLGTHKRPTNLKKEVVKGDERTSQAGNKGPSNAPPPKSPVTSANSNTGNSTIVPQLPPPVRAQDGNNRSTTSTPTELNADAAKTQPEPKRVGESASNTQGEVDESGNPVRNSERPKPPTDTFVVISSFYSGKLIGLGKSSNKGSRAIQREPTNAHEMNWRFVPIDGEWFHIKNRKSRLVLAVGASAKGDGAECLQWSIANPGLEQQWRLIEVSNPEEKLFMIENRNSLKVLSLKTASRDDGIKIVQSSIVPNDTHQHWQIIPVK